MQGQCLPSWAMSDDDVSAQFSPGGWKFTPEVTEVFDEHVSASVPHYADIQRIIAEASDWLLPDNGVYVDIGASTGTTAAVIASRHPDRHIRAYLYDEVPEMLGKAAAKLTGYPNLKVERRLQNVTSRSALDHLASDLVTAVFTLQFIPLHQREEILYRLYSNSKPSGGLIVAEKIRPTHALWAEIANDASHDFKAEHGLSDTAIRQKARTLRGVLRPSTEADLIQMITEAGWAGAEILFRWHQWVVVGALAR